LYELIQIFFPKVFSGKDYSKSPVPICSHWNLFIFIVDSMYKENDSKITPIDKIRERNSKSAELLDKFFNKELPY